MRLSEQISTVKPSATLGITSKAKALKKSGEDIIILAAGEPDFDTPDVVKDAAITAIKEGVTKYTPARGTETLRKAICSKLNRDNGLEYAPNEIVVSNGAKHSIYNALQIICNPGDEILIIPPYWLSYPEMVKLAGAEPVFVPVTRDNGFIVIPEDIKSKITKKTKGIIINSPSNPAGVVYDKQQVEDIAKVCIENDLIIISDEIYEKIIFDGKEHFSIAAVSDEVKKNTIVVNGVSKSYSMTGWRIGYMASCKEIADMVSTAQSHETSNPCSISQVAAECALNTDLTEEMRANRDKFRERRDVLVDRLAKETKIIPFKPEGAFYLFCDISAYGMDSMTFSEKLLDEKKVVVIPGAPFGEDDYVRISFATDMETIEKGIDRIREWTS